MSNDELQNFIDELEKDLRILRRRLASAQEMQVATEPAPLKRKIVDYCTK